MSNDAKQASEGGDSLSDEQLEQVAGGGLQHGGPWISPPIVSPPIITPIERPIGIMPVPVMPPDVFEVPAP